MYRYRFLYTAASALRTAAVGGTDPMAMPEARRRVGAFRDRVSTQETAAETFVTRKCAGRNNRLIAAVYTQ